MSQQLWIELLVGALVIVPLVGWMVGMVFRVARLLERQGNTDD